MKKYWKVIVVVALCVFIVDWMIIGSKLLNNEHNFLPEAWIAGCCWFIVMSNAVYTAVQRFVNKEQV